jgi:molybdopterin-containing oxidoreductase family iron-sulfur binding subunit
MDRRTFLKLGGVLSAITIITPGSQLLMSAASGANSSKKTKWAMVVDLDRCDGCKVCEDSCRDENNVPLYTGDEAQYTAYWLRIAEAKREIPGVTTEDKPVPLLCNHCDDAPCAHVCPTKATFQRDDGLVMIDEHRCIGCRYCVIACPYHARSMVFKDTGDDEWTNRDVPKLMRGVASKCTFCVHRLADDRMPRCVEDCPNNALIFGNRDDSGSEVARLLHESGSKAQVLRPNLEVGPNVYYLGL